MGPVLCCFSSDLPTDWSVPGVADDDYSCRWMGSQCRPDESQPGGAHRLGQWRIGTRHPWLGISSQMPSVFSLSWMGTLSSVCPPLLNWTCYSTRFGSVLPLSERSISARCCERFHAIRHGYVAWSGVGHASKIGGQ